MSPRTSCPAEWPVEHLARALSAAAALQGDRARIAAVRLLVAHERWLHRGDFRRLVDPCPRPYAHIKWADLAAAVDDSDLTRAASSETAILRLACTLVGHVPVDVDPLIAKRWTLHEILRPLDDMNRDLAVDAVRYAALGPAVGGGGR